MKTLSLQWRLTLMTATMVAAACIALTLFLSHSAIMKMDELENCIIELSLEDQGTYVVGIGELPISADLSAQIQQTKHTFRIQSILITLLVISVSSALTYVISGRALASLRQFSASAAHELRTPLAVLRTKLDVLQKKETPTLEEYSETIQMVSEQTERLSNLVSVLLEMTQLRTVERNDTVSLFALVEEVICDLTQIADERNVTLIQENGDATLNGNDLLLYRAVYNLIENAIKYNRPGGTVTAAIRTEHNTAILSITDTGIGIPAENQETIFDPFVRVDKAHSRAMGGAGLGLALVRDIAQKHGGNVRVTKSSPQGTTIQLTLPLS